MELPQRNFCSGAFVVTKTEAEYFLKTEYFLAVRMGTLEANFFMHCYKCIENNYCCIKKIQKTV